MAGSIHGDVKLGKKLGVVHDPRTLRAANYISRAAAKKAPAKVNRTKTVQSGYPMFANDQYGCCVFASQGHALHGFTHGGTHGPANVTREDVLAAYSRVTGFRPEDPSTDNGTYMLDGLNDWRQHGVGGHKIEAFAAMDPKRSTIDQLHTANWLFGGLYLGIWLPVAASRMAKWDVPQSQIDKGLEGEWAPGGWGGHAVMAQDSDRYGVTIATWGSTLRVSWRFFKAYCDECYVVISPDWLHHTHGTESPQGFNRDALLADLAAIT